MDLVALSADLSTQRYMHIVRSKADRQYNRALLLDAHTDDLVPNRVPAMTPSAHFYDGKPRLILTVIYMRQEVSGFCVNRTCPVSERQI